MKRLLSSFLTIIMVIGILASLPVTTSAAEIQTLRPDQELSLTWSSDSVYAYVEVVETGYYDISANGNASYGRYYCYIGSEFFGYSVGRPSDDWDIVAFPYTYSNIYLEKGVEYVLEVTCFDDEYNYCPGNISLVLTKNDYTEIALTSSPKTIVTDENEIQWFTFDTTVAGDYWVDFGDVAAGYVFDYDSSELISYFGNDLSSVATMTLEANTKYKVAACYSAINPQPVKVSFGKHQKDVAYVELYKAACYADEYLEPDNYSYLITYSDATTEIVNSAYFIDRGVNFYLDYIGNYTDEYNSYKESGDQPVSIYYGNEYYTSFVYIISFLDFVSDLDAVETSDDMYISYEDTEYKQYFWHVKITENNVYDLYSYDGWSDTFSWYNIVFFDEYNNPVLFGSDGWVLEAGKEYCLMLEYCYNEYANWDFEFSLEINPDHEHTSSEWIVDKNATLYSTGKRHKECTECGTILKTEKIAQLKCSKPKLKEISNTDSGVKITWSSVKGADSYRVYRKTSKGDWTYIGSTTKTGYTDKSAKSGTKYYYAVRARNEAGNSSLSSSLSKLYLSDPTLKTPSSSKSGIKLTWTKTSGSEGYKVYRKTGSGSYSCVATVKGSTKTTYTDKSAQKGKTYTYKVKAYKSKTYSAYSNTKKIKDKY